ncbi:MAG: hypothetical protein GX443_10380 [Deltaproteobacteria bacterium]|nr:hypothetical protein [Deltaproteobacteria bacterium]
MHWILKILQQAPAFAGSVLASMLQPFVLFGCVLTGALIRNVWLSLLTAGAWALLVQKFIILPRVEAMQWTYTPEMFWGSLLVAWLPTGIVQLIARSRRR